MTIKEASGPPCEVWPDNVHALNVLVAMGTQWRIGMAGATGLDYNALPVVMRMLGINQADREDVFNGVRIMEDTVLEMMRAKK